MFNYFRQQTIKLVMFLRFGKITSKTYEVVQGHVAEVEYYSLCGKLLDNYINPDLIWDEVVFEVPEKPLPNLEVDTKLIVWNKDSRSVKYKRYFSHFSEDGRINVFCMGATSFSADCASANTCVWNEYEVVVASNL